MISTIWYRYRYRILFLNVLKISTIGNVLLLLLLFLNWLDKYNFFKKKKIPLNIYFWKIV